MRRTIIFPALTLAFVGLFHGPARAESPATDKSGYSLSRPTPAAQMRELAPDRPDKTESPFTVDAGHFQVELDLATFTHDRHNSAGADQTVQAWSVAPINLKVGLCNRVDAQLILETYNWVRTRDHATGTTVTQRGFGDVIPRLKINFWGNDGGATAFGMMPFVKLPANQDNLGNPSVEGGVIFPLAVKLPAGFAMGLMTEFDFAQDSARSRLHPEFVNSITFAHDLVGKLGGYVEFFSSVSTESGSDWVGTVDLGLTYGVTENLQLDAGINIGVTRSADDFNPFIGVTWRF